MDVAARVTSKGQITVPKAVRDALGLETGDEVVFRVDGNRAVLARTPDFLSLAGSATSPEIPPRWPSGRPLTLRTSRSYC